MKRSLFLTLVCLFTLGLNLFAQDAIVIEKNDNSKVKFNLKDIKQVTFEKRQPAQNYYVIGGSQDWTQSAKDKSQKFNHSALSVEEDPVFTITIEALENADTWFAIADDEACAAIVENNDWSKLFGPTNGNGLGDYSGSLDRRYELPSNYSFRIPYSGRDINITINMRDYTYEISYDDGSVKYIYEIGNESNWLEFHPLCSVNADGKYQGYYYLDGIFKFCADGTGQWQGDQWGGDAEGNLISDIAGEHFLVPSEAAFYQINVDLNTLTYQLVKVESISVIGGFSGWMEDFDLTYDKAQGCWQITLTVPDTEIKFLMNHSWDYNWGGTADNLEPNEANLTLEEGSYDIKVYLSYPGNHKAVITKLE
ncbi:MAG: hypothetical protein K6A32_03100 [Bacteroidales bacterium]|nr:hypothetical protein [Bacteroidales bacterium]